jgi:high affinity sulfate transporter 1
LTAAPEAAPGWRQLLGYRREWLPHDVAAGVSVAAVALPTAIAYSGIIGLPPVTGLYAAILPLLVYAALGTSRHLIVNPDAATCALVASTLAPLAAGDPASLPALSVVLALLTGAVCIAAGAFRLGFVADFLSRPILVGFLNGVALHILLGQISRLFGFRMESHGIVPSLIELVGKLPQTHVPTLVVGLLALGALLATRRFLPRVPAPLVAIVVGIAVVKAGDLGARGVAVVGAVPAGLPALAWPELEREAARPLLLGALGVALLSFSNAMVVARSFAAKGRYEVDADREFFALGACQIAAGLSQGFAVSGTESRTAMNHAMGGRSPAAGLVAAVLMAAMLLFLTGPLAHLPQAALGAILVMAAVGLFDVREMRHLWQVSWQEFAVALVTMLGVVALGVLDGILLAVLLAILFLLGRASRPPDAVLGRVEGLRGWHDVSHHPGAETQPGLVLYRFGSAIVFFNAPYFKKRVLELASQRDGTRWLVVDGSPINTIDATGAAILDDLAEALRQRGIRLAFANLRSQVRAGLERAGVGARLGEDAFYATLNSARRAFEAQHGRAPAAGPESADEPLTS